MVGQSRAKNNSKSEKHLKGPEIVFIEVAEQGLIFDLKLIEQIGSSLSTNKLPLR